MPRGEGDQEPRWVELFQTPAPFLLTTCLAGEAPPPPRPTAPGPGRVALQLPRRRRRPHCACSFLQQGPQLPFIQRAWSQPPPQDPSPSGVRRASVCVITLRHCSSLERWRQPFLVGPPRAPRLGLLAGLGVSLRWRRARVFVFCCWRAFLGCYSRERGPQLPLCIPQSNGPHICLGSCACCGCMGRWVGLR